MVSLHNKQNINNYNKLNTCYGSVRYKIIFNNYNKSYKHLCHRVIKMSVYDNFKYIIIDTETEDVVVKSSFLK